MTVYLVGLESVESRYTSQWKDHLPRLLRSSGLVVEEILGPSDIPAATTPGAFLNFGGTNIYKSVQTEKISRLFTSDKIQHGDYFLFADAWHPGIINLKYMASLLGKDVKIGALWHAGSYDPQDFLGRLIGDQPWVRSAELSMFHATDHNFFATDFHVDLFKSVLLKGDRSYDHKIVRSGWPMEYLVETCHIKPKRNLILFPHRLAPEKQPEIFRDLAKNMPEYEFVVCQEHALTKVEYYDLLAEAKLVFSANLQETLGISMQEAALSLAVPLVPMRLSYSEIFEGFPRFMYPTHWTCHWNNYQWHREDLMYRIRKIMNSYDQLVNEVQILAQQTQTKFYSAKSIIDAITAGL